MLGTFTRFILHRRKLKYQILLRRGKVATPPRRIKVSVTIFLESLTKDSLDAVNEVYLNNYVYLKGYPAHQENKYQDISQKIQLTWVICLRKSFSLLEEKLFFA